jgi:hypothetical protein
LECSTSNVAGARHRQFGMAAAQCRPGRADVDLYLQRSHGFREMLQEDTDSPIRRLKMPAASINMVEAMRDELSFRDSRTGGDSRNMTSLTWHGVVNDA